MTRLKRTLSMLPTFFSLIFLLLLSACGGGTDVVQFRLSGTVTGLADGQQVVLLNNGGDALTITSNKVFTFSQTVPFGSSYNVSVGTQPNGQTCTVSNGFDDNIDHNVTDISVVCSATTYTVSGTVTGLADAKQVTLLNNMDLGHSATVSANGGFVFSMPIASGSGYKVTVDKAASTQACNVFNGIGTDVTADVTGVEVVCDTTVLYSFGGKPDGSTPLAALISGGDGNFYGTTNTGGTSDFGTIFKIAPSGSDYTILHSFDGATFADALPNTPLTLGSDGFLFGLTPQINEFLGGSIFVIHPNVADSYQVVFFFRGDEPVYGLKPSAAMVARGNTLFGVTERGGQFENGVLFEANFDTGRYSVLHSFTPSSGAIPRASLLFRNDLVYGTTTEGGADGAGTIFSFDPNNLSSYTPIHNFTGSIAIPTSGGLIADNNGVLYGMTNTGGAHNAGTIFSIDPTSRFYNVIHDFGTPGDGMNPVEGLTLGPDGFFYGVTQNGGTHGHGTLFKFDPTDNISYEVLISFDGANGMTPVGTLLLGPDNHFYGVTAYGGEDNKGTVFKY